MHGCDYDELNRGDPRRDDLVVIEYAQDADSFGWKIAALFHVALFPDKLRWGTMDALTSTDVGAGDSNNAVDVRSAVRRMWHLADWHKTEAEARAAYTELKSRVW